MIAIIKTTISRETGQVIREEVVKQVDMSEDEYFRSLVEVLGNRFLREYKNKGGERVEDSGMAEKKAL